MTREIPQVVPEGWVKHYIVFVARAMHVEKMWIKWVKKRYKKK